MNTLYISDLDGTLLNTKSVLSDFTKETLNSLINQGMMFSVATARTTATVMKIFSEVSLSLPVILMSGALTYDSKSKKYINVKYLNKDLSSRVFEVLENNQISAFVYTLEDNYIHAFHKKLDNSFTRKFRDDRLGSGYKSFHEIDNYNNLSMSMAPMLIMVMDSFEKITKAHGLIKELQGITTYCYRDVFDKNLGYLEIYAENTSKAEAINNLASSLAVDRLVVFGDNLNDLPMFEIADEAYAVGNAFPEVKAAATAVIGANHEDGVARFLLKAVPQPLSR